MSFQTLIDKIQTKTGKSPAELITIAKELGLFEPGTKAAAVISWLKTDFELIEGDAIAMYGLFKHLGAIKPKSNPNTENQQKINKI